MTVEILSLSGLAAGDARHAADELLDLDTGPDRLERLLVLDDTGQLDDHALVYQHIDNAKRVAKLLCLTVGPRSGDGRKLDLPGSLGGTQGWPVLWVSRPAGIDWKVAKAAVANRHPGSTPAAVDQHPIVRLLLIEEMFDRVYETFLGGETFPSQVQGRVASPGLWLAGAEDEAATFAGALAVAIRRVCEPGAGNDGPFGELLPARAGGADLAENGPFARYLGRVTEMDREATHALGRASGLGGMLRRGDGSVQSYVGKVGDALADLRDLSIQVLWDASAGPPGELTANQRDLVRNAGVNFAVGDGLRASQAAGSTAEQSLVHRAVAAAIRGGDAIPLVAKRLMATEREVTRHGSASYLPEVDKWCPQELLARLADTPRKVPRHAGVVEGRRELGLDEARGAAHGLRDLLIGVANREWSPTGVTSRELAGTLAALEGARRALTERADVASSARASARGARQSRLGESLIPVLCDLVLRVVADELASPSASGQEARRVAQDRAVALLDDWTRHMQAHGVTAQPSFASASAEGLRVIEDDVADVREALLYPVRNEMWQLCAPGDLGALDVDAPTLSIRFASRLTRDALGVVPGDEPVWTSSGSFAGVLRLVPLRAGVAVSSWGKSDPAGAPDPVTTTEP